MTVPEVCCVMLADGRHDMVRRAIDSFARQDYYGEKRLLIWDTSAIHNYAITGGECAQYKVPITQVRMPERRGATIGALRNEANSQVHEPIILHWDSDDWSYPGRITEQVALLWATDYTAVGYNDMVFWDERVKEAWLYRNPNPRWCLGTSLCYLRKAWERNPFPNTSKGEDNAWIRNQNVKAVSSVTPKRGLRGMLPAMIASIHDDNTCARIHDGSQEWNRAPEWTNACLTIMDNGVLR